MTENTKHLLIVEDEAPQREAVAEQLADHGFHVVQASTGEPSLSAGCQVMLQTKLRTARSNTASFDGRSRVTSTVRPSVDTLTHSSDGRGVSATSSGRGTNGGLTGLGRSSKHEPSAL